MLKIIQVTTNPDIPLFKKFRYNRKSVDPDKIQCYKENFALHLTVSEIDDLLEWRYKEKILNSTSRCHAPSSMDSESNLFPKISLLNDQFKITSKDKVALLEVCLFIQPWLQCILAVKAPYQYLCFMKSMRAYEKIDKSIAKAALQKISQHL
ncbi:hypothetical protein J437_LFUL014424, partial [Ladona fulva]